MDNKIQEFCSSYGKIFASHQFDEGSGLELQTTQDPSSRQRIVYENQDQFINECQGAVNQYPDKTKAFFLGKIQGISPQYFKDIDSLFARHYVSIVLEATPSKAPPAQVTFLPKGAIQVRLNLFRLPSKEQLGHEAGHLVDFLEKIENFYPGFLEKVEAANDHGMGEEVRAESAKKALECFVNLIKGHLSIPERKFFEENLGPLDTMSIQEMSYLYVRFFEVIRYGEEILAPVRKPSNENINFARYFHEVVEGFSLNASEEGRFSVKYEFPLTVAYYLSSGQWQDFKDKCSQQGLDFDVELERIVRDHPEIARRIEFFKIAIEGARRFQGSEFSAERFEVDLP